MGRSWDPEIYNWPLSRIYSLAAKRWVLPYHQKLARELRALEISGRFVDLGAGNGQLGVEIARIIPDSGIWTTDASADMVGLAAREISARAAGDSNLRLAERVKPLRADAHSLPLADESVDVVMSCGSLHHMRDLGAVFAEAWRVVRNRGWFYILDGRRPESEEDRQEIRKTYGWKTPFVLAGLKEFLTSRDVFMAIYRTEFELFQQKDYTLYSKYILIKNI